MKRKIPASLMALLICTALIGTALADVYKDEVVYARLNARGGLEGVYVINAFEADAVAQVNDRGRYSEVLPLQDLAGFTYMDGLAAFEMPAGRFSYQGTPENAALPWVFEFSYRLDGRDIAPEDLSGASGHLEMTLAITVNEDLRDFADSLSLQLTLTLDGGKAVNISAPKATYALAGGNRTLAYVVLPGQAASYTLSADVRDFSMPGIQMAGVRMGMDEDMYQAVAGEAMAGSPLQTAVSGLMGNFLKSMQGQASPSFTDPGNAVRSVQFVLMAQGIPQKEEIAQEAAEAPPANFWQRILKVFGL